MINRCVLVGRTTRDIELRTTQSGRGVASFSLAVDRGRKDADGNSVTDFFSCVAWEKTAELLKNYVRKGSLIAVAGRLQTRRYTDKAGEEKLVTEIVVDEVQFCESRRDSEQRPQTAAEPVAVQTPQDVFKELLGDDDKLPF